VGDLVQRFQALDDRTAVGAGQLAQRADSRALNRAVDEPGEVLAGLAQVADQLPEGVSRA